ncbi:MAG: hypothetical protein FWC54_02710 [Actinomycetia bacterium]|nr:hypothetical protein [Actinomycetes bacterium]
MSLTLKETGAQLLALQEIDTARRAQQDQIETLPQKRTVAALRAKQAEGQARITQIEERIAEVALQEEVGSAALATVETKIAEEQAKIDVACDHREVSALTQELDTLARRKDALEDENLALLQKQQDLENLRSDTEEKLAALAARERDEIAQYQKQLASLKAELAELDAQRAKRADTLPADLLAHYDALAQEKGGVVVARFLGGRCLACSIVPPTSQRALIEASDEIECCPQCRRLLVVED